MKSNIAIIILNYKKYNLTISCVKEIFKYNENVSVFIVDNFSNNNSLENIKLAFSAISSHCFNEDDLFWSNSFADDRLFFIQANDNYGYARGNNIGLRFSLNGPYEYIAILNNDIIITDGIFINLESYITVNRIDEKYVLFGPLLFHKDGTVDSNCAKKQLSFFDLILMSPLGFKLKKTHRKKGADSQYEHFFFKKNARTEVDIISGSFMFFRRKLFSEIEGFDPNTFLYFEEPILCKQIQDKGYRVMFLPMFNAIHLHGATTTSESRMFQVKETYKSLIYYLAKYTSYSWFYKLLIILFFKISIILLKFKFKFIKK